MEGGRGVKKLYFAWVILFKRPHTEHYQKISTSNLYRNTIIFLFLPWEPICDFKRERNIQVTQKSFIQDRNFTLGCFYAMATCNMPLSKKECVTKTGNHDEIKLSLQNNLPATLLFSFASITSMKAQTLKYLKENE